MRSLFPSLQVAFFPSLSVVLLAGLASPLLLAGELPGSMPDAIASHAGKKDAAGAAVAFAGDFNQDGFGDYVVGIPGFDVKDSAGKVIKRDAGRAVVISGKDGSALASIIGAAAKDAMGFAVAGNADINADGFADVVVGAPRVDHGRSKDSGSVTVLFGRADTNPVIVPKQTLYGATAKSLFGYSVALGDVDANGKADIVIGAPRANDLRNPAHKLIAAGSVTVIDGSTLTAWQPIYYGATAGALAGSAVAVGNVNAAAGDEIIVGAPYDDDIANGWADTGSVTVYNIANVEPVIPRLYGIVGNAHLGKAVAAGNVDAVIGDEVLAGAPGDDLFVEVEEDDWNDDNWDDDSPIKMKRIPDTGSVTVFDGGNGWARAKFYGEVARAGMGNSVAAGDINGDGIAEIIVGASRDDSPVNGGKKIVDAGSVSIWTGDGYLIGSTLYGSVARDYFGTSVSAGDVDGDGSADLIIGIPGFDQPATATSKIIKDTGAVKALSGAEL